LSAPPERLRPTLTLADLERWVENGATWRAVEVSDARVVVELRACTGEPVDLVAGEAPDLVAYVRDRRAAGR
jgi:hypothetical protein